MPRINNHMEQLLAFRWGPIWDGNIMSKTVRDRLYDKGFIERGANGMQWLSAKGVEVLGDLAYLTQDTWSERRD